MIPTAASRADMHCHSTASQISKLGVQRSLGLPECATPPEEVYELAKRRGMDFVTITDHDTIDGCLELADRPDVFISEELTAWFRGEPQAVHVLCYGITPEDHEWLQAHFGDLELCAAYLQEREITRALAHPFYAVEAPLTARHRRRLAELFGIWETRNGSRARELNMPAAVYIETHGGIGIGGSDDHAGVDIGRTFTETPSAPTPEEFLRHVREGRAEARGGQGSAGKWAHSAIALAARSLVANGESPEAPLAPGAVLAMAERVMSEGNARKGEASADLGPEDGRALLAAWLESIDLPTSARELIALMQADDFSHADLERRARREHERRLRSTVTELTERIEDIDLSAAGSALFDACLPAIPYAPAAAFLGREKSKLISRHGEPGRVAVVTDAIGSMHGVTHTIEQIRERGVPGFEVEVIGTDGGVDRRLPEAIEIEVPTYEGMGVGIPSLPGVVDGLAEGGFDLVHLTSPGPAGLAAALVAHLLELPTIGSYHTELAAYAGLRSGDESLERTIAGALSLFYRQCEVVLSPSPATDDSLRSLGIDGARIGRWERGVDLARFGPGKRTPQDWPGEIHVLYAGRLTKEKGADLLAESFLRAQRQDPRLHLVLAGGGPEEEALRERLDMHATFLGWLHGNDLARAYASADTFLFASRTDTFGQVILEAQASGLPVLAVDEGGPASLIEDGETGLLRAPDPDALSTALLLLASSEELRQRIAKASLFKVRERTWERAMVQLGAGYERALELAAAPAEAQPRRHAA
jgi:glycosyltransferase involved in cell wall biosynthesis/predicted metal-dependent phosphoesterase TrpH